MISTRLKTSLATALLVVSPLVLGACDGDSGLTDGLDPQIRISGVVTDDASAGKSAGEVEEADVRGREIDRQGRTTPAEGETTTDENGRYVLESSGSAEFMLVTATRDGFESSVVVDTRAQASGPVGAVPMTTESKSEAAVFLESRSQGHEHVSMAEIAAEISARAAARIEAGFASASSVAAAIGHAEAAERHYLESEHGVSSTSLATFDAREEGAYRTFQTQVTGGVGASVFAEADAEMLAEVSTSGDDPVAGARAREAGRSALIRLSTNLDAEMRFELRQRAELQSAVATSVAAEMGFQSMGSARLGTVTAAGASLFAEIESADSEADFDAAWRSYSTALRAQIAAELGISTVALNVALDALSALNVSLDASLDSANGIDGVVSAKAEYFAQAEASLRQALGVSAEAATSAGILALVEVH